MRKIYLIFFCVFFQNTSCFVRDAVQETEYQSLKGHLLKKMEEKVPDVFERWCKFKSEKNLEYNQKQNKYVFFNYAKHVTFIEMAKKNKEFSHEVGENEFIHISREEYLVMSGLVVTETEEEPASERSNIYQPYSPYKWREPIPPFDWRQKNKVTPVKKQGYCGGCYTFATLSTLESAMMIKDPSIQTIELSEQCLIDCSRSYGNEGCNGGGNPYVFKFMMNNSIPSEISYPYLQRDSICHKYAGVSPIIRNFGRVPFRDEYALSKAVANIGPVAVGIDASLNSFKYYRSGIYDDPGCSHERACHAVAIVGIGDYPQPHYIIKNSWGEDWGEKGFFRLARNGRNTCAVTSQATYPIL